MKMVGVVQALSIPIHPAARLINNWDGRPTQNFSLSTEACSGFEVRQVQNRLAPDKVAELVACYQAGAQIDELAVQFGVNRSTVMAHRDRAGVERRSRSLSSEHIRDGAVLYAKGLSLREVGRQFGVDGETVRTAFRKHGVPVRQRGGRIKRRNMTE
jgi:DNA-binding CsgD family transcriptional regulator